MSDTAGPAAPAAAMPPDPDGFTLWQWQQRILRWTNEFRAKSSLPPLAFDTKLVQAAWEQCRNCYHLGTLTHWGADGSGPWDRIAKFGYSYRSCSENAAWFPWAATERDAVDGWIGSPPHRANLLGDWADLGAARIPDGRGGVYWIADFAR